MDISLEVSDVFKNSTCGLCGNCELNQYFSINDKFIEYNGVYCSFREILAVAVDLVVSALFSSKVLQWQML